MKRTTFTPIALALVAATFLTAFWSWLFLNGEFHQSKWIVDPHPPLPPLTALLGAVYPFVWLLPIATLVFAVRLRRRPEIPAAHVSWYVSSVVFALFLWILLIVVALALVYSMHHWYAL